MKRHSRRRDDNEPDVVAARQAAGAGVQRLDGRGMTTRRPRAAVAAEAADRAMAALKAVRPEAAE